MVKPLWRDILREIWKTRARFISLIMITMLGSMSVVGIQAAVIDMRDIADQTYKAQNLYDIHIKSSTGFTADDVGAVMDLPEVYTAMPTYSFDAYTAAGGELAAVRVFALPGAPAMYKEPMNRVTLTSGRLPERPGEIAIERRWLREGGLGLGDTVTLSLDGGDLPAVLVTDTFTVVGTVTSPFYLTHERGRTSLGNGQLRFYAYLHPDAYVLEVYTDLYVRMEGSHGIHHVSDEYDGAVPGWVERLERVGEERAEAFRAELRDARKDIEQGWAEYHDGLRELEKKLLEARNEIHGFHEELVQWKLELDYALSDLNFAVKDGLAEIEKNERELIEGRKELDAKKKEINEGQEALDMARSEILAGLEALEAIAPPGFSPELDMQYEQLYGALEILGIRQAGLDAGRAELQAAEKTLSDGFAEIEQAKLTLEAERKSALAKIEEGWEEVNAGLEQYNEALAELSKEEKNALAELNEAKEKLEDAQEKLDAAPAPAWYYFTRADGTAFDSYHQDTQRLQKIGFVFPMVFFLVAVLVSLTSMSRMVEEHRTQIGIYKALGYRPASIMIKYALYAVLSGAVGGLLGVFIGSEAFPLIIADAYGHLYDMPPIETPVPWDIASFAIAAAVLSVAVVTVLSVAGAMKGEPAILMRPKTPKAGKRVLIEKIPFIWNRLGFIGKVTARNIFRFKRRFLMTLAGVAGCTALLLTAFGLRDSLDSVTRLHYTEIIRYDALVYTGGKLDEPPGGEYLYIHEESFQAGTLSAALIVPEDFHALDNFISVGSAYGILVTEKLARGLDGEIFGAPIAAVVENYVMHYVYMPPEIYRELFGKDPEYNGLFIKGSVDAAGLIARDGVRAVVMTEHMMSMIGDSTDAMGVVTVVLIVLACALAFIVLFNLTVINITERTRELATIKVLGFQDTDTAIYLYRENLTVTLMGIAAGLFGGVYLEGFIITSVEIDLLKFPQEIYPASFFIAAGLSLLFSLFVNAVTYRKLMKIDMVESLKNIE